MGEETTVDPLARAAMHPIVRDRPGPGFFEGALLGNGGLGAVVTTRPDAVVLHFGHNNVWDIRIAEDNKEKIGVFQELFEKVKAIPGDLPSLEADPWYRDYLEMTQANYRKPYPRPFPCGSVLLGFDRRKVELLGYRVDIAAGMCAVNLLVDGQPAQLQLFVDMDRDFLWLRLVDAENHPLPNCFERVKLIPDPDTPNDLPAYRTGRNADQGTLSFTQVLPFNEPVGGKPGESSPEDRAFCLSLRVNAQVEGTGRIDLEGHPQELGRLERFLVSSEPFLACVQLDEGLASEVGEGDVPVPADAACAAAAGRAKGIWRDYWNRSGVALDDAFLEQIWYWNHYFFRCAARAGVNCPGLFANWSYTAWHGDYHMNYNTQQPFWVTFSSNHVDKHLPYVDLVDFLRPISRQWARDYYGLRGAYYPHSAYPVEMTMFPYPVPGWGWEVCETPWSVQSLWWHYLYTQDRAFLAERVFEPIRESVLFLVDYMTRPDAHGERWGDDRYHVFPTVPPELYGLMPGFRFNHDCIADLTLIRFVFNAYLQACDILGRADTEAETMAAVRDILAKFPEYPTAESQRGTVWVSVPGEHPEIVYNCATSTMPIFPGEEVGLGSPAEQYELAATTYRNQSNEGGNDLVFLNVQGARLGLLDLDRFRRQLRYCLLPNGTHSDVAMQALGRYSDTTPFDFMVDMGIWLENFAVPFVINECLMQSYDGTLRLFPNWPLDEKAEFHTLRAVGAFLVSAACADGQVQWVRITSEAGAPLRLILPWAGGAEVARGDGSRSRVAGPLLELDTVAGETIEVRPAAA